MLCGIIIIMAGFMPSSGASQEIDPFYLQRLENGERSFIDGNYETAIKELDIALFGLQTSKRLKAKALLYLGMSHFYLSDNEKARTCLKESKDLLGMEGLRAMITDESIWYYLNRSMLELKLIEPDTNPMSETAAPPRKHMEIENPDSNAKTIEKDLEKQIKASPQDVALYYVLYEHHVENGDIRAAKKTIANLIKSNPNEARGYLLMGKIQYKQKDLNAAEKNLQKVFELQNKVNVEEHVLLDAIIYQILTARLKGDKNRAYEILNAWSEILTEEKIRYMDIDDQDRSILQGIFESEDLKQPSSEETSPNTKTESSITNVFPLEILDIQPSLKKRVDPQYPSIAAQLGIRGQVTVDALIAETGDVIQVEVIKELPAGLTEETVKAVRQWKYEPAVKDGQAVKVWKRITITFK